MCPQGFISGFALIPPWALKKYRAYGTHNAPKFWCDCPDSKNITQKAQMSYYTIRLNTINDWWHQQKISNKKKEKEMLESSNISFIVGIPGFEPGTPCSQSRCANRTALHPAIIFKCKGTTYFEICNTFQKNIFVSAEIILKERQDKHIKTTK